MDMRKNGLKRLTAALSAVTLLLSGAACSAGGGSATVTDAVSAGDAVNEEAAVDDVAVSPVEAYPADTVLRCKRTETADGSALAGWTNSDPASGYYEPMLMRVKATGLTAEKSVFDIVIRCDESRANLRHAFEAQPVGRKGSAILFALRDPGISDTYYLYNLAEGALTPLGRNVTVSLCGNAIFVLPAAEGSYAPRSLSVFDWKGQPVAVLDEIVDLRLYEGDLWLLTAGSGLEKLTADQCKAPFDGLVPEQICVFGGHTAEFIANTDDALFLFPHSGRKIVACNLTGAAETAAALQNSAGLPAAALCEKCDLFTVVLPASWLGQYVCETRSDGLYFYHKASRDAGAGGFLFSLYAFPAAEAESRSGEAPLVANYNDNGDLRCIALGGPSANQFTEATRAAYERLREDRFAVVRTISMSHPYSETWLNYQGFRWGVFRGADASGGLYTFTPRLITDRAFEGTLTFTPPTGAPQTADVTCSMDNGLGQLTLTGESLSGGGIVSVKHDADLLLTLTEVPAGWTAEPGMPVELTALR